MLVVLEVKRAWQLPLHLHSINWLFHQSHLTFVFEKNDKT